MTRNSSKFLKLRFLKKKTKMNFILLATLIGIFTHQITTVCIGNVREEKKTSVIATSTLSTDVPVLIASKIFTKCMFFIISLHFLKLIRCSFNQFERCKRLHSIWSRFEYS